MDSQTQTNLKGFKMAAKKLEDTKYIKVRVSNRNPDSEEMSTFIGGNNVIINGTSNVKHYTIELDKEVELPEHFVTQLEDRSMVVQDKRKRNKRVKLFVVERV